jgi:hypothetical protein
MISYKYLGEALFFLSAGISIFRWTLRTTAETLPASGGAGPDPLELPEMLPALVARGVAPPEVIARMTPAERVALYDAVFGAAGEDRRRDPSGAWKVACSGCGKPLGAGIVPVGYLTSCPHCGAAIEGRRTSG